MLYSFFCVWSIQQQKSLIFIFYAWVKLKKIVEALTLTHRLRKQKLIMKRNRNNKIIFFIDILITTVTTDATVILNHRNHLFQADCSFIHSIFFLLLFIAFPLLLCRNYLWPHSLNWMMMFFFWSSRRENEAHSHRQL